MSTSTQPYECMACNKEFEPRHRHDYHCSHACLKASVDRTRTWKTARWAKLEAANELLFVISTHGRKFFAPRGNDGQTHDKIERGNGGQLVYVQQWNNKRIYLTAKQGYWHGFSGGGTLRGLIQQLVEFIRTGRKVRAGTFGDHWGYGDEMAKVIAAGQAMGVVAGIHEDLQ